MMDEETQRIVELADLLRPLLKSPGWDTVKRLAQSRVDEVMVTLALPLHERDSKSQAPSDEYLRGAIYGLQFCFAQTGRILSEAERLTATHEDD